MYPSWFDPERLAAIDRWLIPEEDEEKNQKAADPKEAAWKAYVVLIATPLLLTWQHYGFTGGGLEWLGHALASIGFPALLDWLTGPDFTEYDRELVRLLGWSAGALITGVFTPMAIIIVVFREWPSAFGNRLHGSSRETLWAIVFLLVMVPIVYIMSGVSSFQERYPFYKFPVGFPLWPRWYIWEFFYGLQFIAVEFLFRGFMVHGLRQQFGGFAVPVMTIPYCMIHFGKPWQETCAAVVAGLALGWLSLRTRSIWWGVLLHISVAWSMDALVLWRAGHFSTPQ